MGKKRIVIILILAVSSFLFYSCGSHKDKLQLEKGASAKILFQKAMTMMKKHPENARKYFREIVQLFPNSSYAPEAKYQIGYSYFKQRGFDNYLMAIQEFRDFVSLYPSHPLAPQAQYFLALSYYRMIRKPGRDQDNTEKALVEFKKLISMYPLTMQAKKAKKLVRKCETNLAEHIFLIGHYYYKTKDYLAARIRFIQIIDKYPNYINRDKVYWYLGQLYLKTKQYKKALDYLNKAASEFKHSKYGYKSYHFLKKKGDSIKAKIKEEK
jgi:outer membrane protein assembly factor BamD